MVGVSKLLLFVKGSEQEQQYFNHADPYLMPWITDRISCQRLLV